MPDLLDAGTRPEARPLLGSTSSYRMFDSGVGRIILSYRILCCQTASKNRQIFISSQEEMFCSEIARFGQLTQIFLQNLLRVLGSYVLLSKCNQHTELPEVCLKDIMLKILLLGKKSVIFHFFACVTTVVQ